MDLVKNYQGFDAKCKVSITVQIGIKSHSEKGKKDAVFHGVYGQKSSSHFERLFSLIFWHFKFKNIKINSFFHRFWFILSHEIKKPSEKLRDADQKKKIWLKAAESFRKYAQYLLPKQGAISKKEYK